MACNRFDKRGAAHLSPGRKEGDRRVVTSGSCWQAGRRTTKRRSLCSAPPWQNLGTASILFWPRRGRSVGADREPGPRLLSATCSRTPTPATCRSSPRAPFKPAGAAAPSTIRTFQRATSPSRTLPTLPLSEYGAGGRHHRRRGAHWLEMSAGIFTGIARDQPMQA